MKVRMVLQRYGDPYWEAQELEIFEGTMAEVIERTLQLSKAHWGRYPAKPGQTTSGVSLVWAEHLNNELIITVDMINRRRDHHRWRIYIEPGNHEQRSKELVDSGIRYNPDLRRIPYREEPVEEPAWEYAQETY